MPNPSFDSNRGNRAKPERDSIPRMPRWAKVFGVIALIIVVVLFVILHVPLFGDMAHHMGHH
jgi:hypothetical protein